MPAPRGRLLRSFGFVIRVQNLLADESYRFPQARLADGGSFYMNHLAWADDLLFRCRQSAIDGDNAISSDAIPRFELDRQLP